MPSETFVALSNTQRSTEQVQGIPNDSALSLTIWSGFAESGLARRVARRNDEQSKKKINSRLNPADK